MEPRIQVDAARKRLEPVIGDDHEQRIVADLLHDTTDKIVHARVQILNHAGPLIFGHIAHSGMIFL